jgi:hypothetical protein
MGRRQEVVFLNLVSVAFTESPSFTNVASKLWLLAGGGTSVGAWLGTPDGSGGGFDDGMPGTDENSVGSQAGVSDLLAVPKKAPKTTHCQG